LSHGRQLNTCFEPVYNLL